jgi:hypothetical protein
MKATKKQVIECLQSTIVNIEAVKNDDQIIDADYRWEVQEIETTWDSDTAPVMRTFRPGPKTITIKVTYL